MISLFFLIRRFQRPSLLVWKSMIWEDTEEEENDLGLKTTNKTLLFLALPQSLLNLRLRTSFMVMSETWDLLFINNLGQHLFSIGV